MFDRASSRLARVALVVCCAVACSTPKPGRPEPATAARVAASPPAATPAAAPPARYPDVDADLAKFDERVATMNAEFARTPANPRDKAWVQRKIAHMFEVDQYMRKWAMGRAYQNGERAYFEREFAPRWQAIDEGNTADLEQLMGLYDWFRISDFGRETSDQAWLLAQHADRKPEFQRAVLAKLASLYKTGEALPQNYAYLYDRVAVGEKRPQRYGTQGRCLPGGWEPERLEDPQRVDEYRAEVGLPPLEQYRLAFEGICPGPPSSRTQARAAYHDKRFGECGPLYEQAATTAASQGTRASDLYNAACCFALAGDSDRAFALLTRVIDAGTWTDREWSHMQADTDLESLRADPRWRTLLDRR